MPGNVETDGYNANGDATMCYGYEFKAKSGSTGNNDFDAGTCKLIVTKIPTAEGNNANHSCL